MKYRPRHNWLVVSLVSREKTPGGIILPYDDQRIARVEEVGPGDRFVEGKLIPIDLKPGDVVFIALPLGRKDMNERYIGAKADNRLLVMDEEIICKCEEETPKIVA